MALKLGRLFSAQSRGVRIAAATAVGVGAGVWWWRRKSAPDPVTVTPQFRPQVLSTNEKSALELSFGEMFSRIRADIAPEEEKRKKLCELDCFVLDNSIRESTVGQLRGHTLDDKKRIYEEVKKCGFKHIVVAAFSHMRRVDDDFVEWVVEQGDDMSRTLWAFVEVSKGAENGVLDAETIPASMVKMKEYGLKNPIIEIDLADKSIDWNKFTMDDMCELLRQRMEWILANLSRDAKILVNLRDFPIAMACMNETPEVTQRVFTVVAYLASLPPLMRDPLLGLMYEDATGNYLPEQLSAWTAAVRRIMNSHGWESGKLLVHVHKKWGLAEAVQLECLSNGANGIWAGLSEEGAAMGHACSAITLMNLVRLGNEYVRDQYECTYLRKAAREVTNITTGEDPHPKQVVYGERSLDLTFGFGDIAGGQDNKGEFDMAKFFHEERPNRITESSSADMIVNRLTELFGEDPQFTKDLAVKMRDRIGKELRSNTKEEYMSVEGIALLFGRAGGHITVKMEEVINKKKLTKEQEKLIAEVRDVWDKWDLRDEVQGDDKLQFDSFYDGFLGRYFGTPKCDGARRVLQALDMDKNGFIDWKEFRVYLIWAVEEYHHINDAEELLSFAFRKAIIPDSLDEELKD